MEKKQKRNEDETSRTIVTLWTGDSDRRVCTARQAKNVHKQLLSFPVQGTGWLRFV